MIPKTYLIGVTEPQNDAIYAYLRDTDQLEFLEEFLKEQKRHGNITLSSFYAKLCYKSLVEDKNPNLTQIRGIEDNIKATFNQGHGSVFEHIWFNFVTTNCSRVFTHELVRHRVGTAFSQTSGRYCAIDKIDLVLPPEVESNPEAMKLIEDTRCYLEENLVSLREILIPEKADFTLKKKLTSAIRRLAPNGQTNEIGWSANIRSLRHMIEMRTARGAEWEIRYVFNEVADLLMQRVPLLLYGAEITEVEGLKEYTNLKV